MTTLSNSLAFHVAAGEDQPFWDNSQGVIDKFWIHPINVISAGELIYIGTSLHDITGKYDTEDADYTIKLRVTGTQNLDMEFRVRRVNEDNYIALKINFETDTISIVETVAGVQTTLDSASHDFKFLGRVKYDFGITMLGETISGSINEYDIVQATTATFRTEPGLSINFPSIDSEDPPLLYSIGAIETVVFPDPQELENDPGDILTTFRESITQQIENPTERTWDSYRKAILYYEQRDVGMPNHIWEELGYPIKKPSAEEWFGNL